MTIRQTSRTGQGQHFQPGGYPASAAARSPDLPSLCPPITVCVLFSRLSSVAGRRHSLRLLEEPLPYPVASWSTSHQLLSLASLCGRALLPALGVTAHRTLLGGSWAPRSTQGGNFGHSAIPEQAWPSAPGLASSPECPQLWQLTRGWLEPPELRGSPGHFIFLCGAWKNNDLLAVESRRAALGFPGGEAAR